MSPDLRQPAYADTWVCGRCDRTHSYLVLACPYHKDSPMSFTVIPDTESKEKADHPAHYGGADNPYEVIKVAEKWLTREEFIGAMKFNIIKYLARAQKKGNPALDCEKAGKYSEFLNDYIKRHP